MSLDVVAASSEEDLLEEALEDQEMVHRLVLEEFLQEPVDHLVAPSVQESTEEWPQQEFQLRPFFQLFFHFTHCCLLGLLDKAAGQPYFLLDV